VLLSKASMLMKMSSRTGISRCRSTYLFRRFLYKSLLLLGIRSKAREIVNVFAGFSAPAGFCKVKSMKTLTVDHRVKDFLTDADYVRTISKSASSVPTQLRAPARGRAGARQADDDGYQGAPDARTPGEDCADEMLVCSTNAPAAVPSGLRFIETPSVPDSADVYEKLFLTTPPPSHRR
jgi:hypothetical protein